MKKIKIFFLIFCISTTVYSQKAEIQRAVNQSEVTKVRANGKSWNVNNVSLPKSVDAKYVFSWEKKNKKRIINYEKTRHWNFGSVWDMVSSFAFMSITDYVEYKNAVKEEEIKLAKERARIAEQKRLKAKADADKNMEAFALWIGGQIEQSIDAVTDPNSYKTTNKSTSNTKNDYSISTNSDTEIIVEKKSHGYECVNFYIHDNSCDNYKVNVSYNGETDTYTSNWIDAVYFLPVTVSISYIARDGLGFCEKKISGSVTIKSYGSYYIDIR